MGLLLPGTITHSFGCAPRRRHWRMGLLGVGFDLTTPRYCSPWEMNRTHTPTHTHTHTLAHQVTAVDFTDSFMSEQCFGGKLPSNNEYAYMRDSDERWCARKDAILCTHTHTSARTHTHTHTRTYIHTYIHTYTRTHTHTHTGILHTCCSTTALRVVVKTHSLFP